MKKTENKLEIEKRQTLTINNVKSLILKRVKWFAPAAEGNLDYEGIAIIKSVDINKRNPLITETISGDNLAFAFLDKTMQGKILCDSFCYSDADRYITFIIQS